MSSHTQKPLFHPLPTPKYDTSESISTLPSTSAFLSSLTIFWLSVLTGPLALWLRCGITRLSLDLPVLQSRQICGRKGQLRGQRALCMTVCLSSHSQTVLPKCAALLLRFNWVFPPPFKKDLISPTFHEVLPMKTPLCPVTSSSHRLHTEYFLNCSPDRSLLQSNVDLRPS